jgi:hypothetical protein
MGMGPLWQQNENVVFEQSRRRRAWLPEDEQEVSARMKKYWADRREGKQH